MFEFVSFDDVDDAGTWLGWNRVRMPRPPRSDPSSLLGRATSVVTPRWADVWRLQSTTGLIATYQDRRLVAGGLGPAESKRWTVKERSAIPRGDSLYDAESRDRIASARARLPGRTVVTLTGRRKFDWKTVRDKREPPLKRMNVSGVGKSRVLVARSGDVRVTIKQNVTNLSLRTTRTTTLDDLSAVEIQITGSGLPRTDAVVLSFLALRLLLSPIRRRGGG